MKRQLIAATLAAAGLLACGVGLSGCGSTIASLPYIGEPAEAQSSRPVTTPDYPDAFVKPVAESKPLTPTERQKLEAELASARDRSAAERREQINQPTAR